MLENIHKGKTNLPPRVVMYGQEGIGKSSWSAKAPKPIFIPTEDGLGEIDCDSFPQVTSYDDVLECLKALGTEEHEYQTVVIDSADWLEPMICDHLCRIQGCTLHQVNGGYGHEYDAIKDCWENITAALNWLRNERKMISIILAHSAHVRVNDPENPAYDKYSLKLQAKSTAHLVEWADCVFFATKRMRLETDGAKRSIARPIGASGGERIIRTVAGPACTAKSRYPLPDELPLEWDAFYQAYKESK